MRLNNGAEILSLAMRIGGFGVERPYVGYVLAHTQMGAHKYVTWECASDDGDSWDCMQGNYFHDVEEAYDNWLERVTRGTSYVKEGNHEVA